MTIQEINELVTEYSVLFHTGKISKEEYTDLLKGLDVSASIAESEEELQMKEHINTALNTTIAALSMV